VFKGRIIVITGASGGIGAQIALRLAEQGARLVLVAREADLLDALGGRLAGAGHRWLAVDFTELADLERARQLVESVTDRVDILVNGAGISTFGMYEDLAPAAIARMVAVNVTAAMVMTRMLLPALKRSPAAQIVNIGSTFGSIGYPGFTAYSATKFALRGFSQALRRELADTAIRVTYVAPRATRTPLNSAAVCELNAALGIAMDEPAAVADKVIAAMRHPADHYLGWPEKLFVRINNLLPGLVDRNLRRQLGVVRRFGAAAAQTPK
jgi:short-subunit dehydrogenase